MTRTRFLPLWLALALIVTACSPGRDHPHGNGHDHDANEEAHGDMTVGPHGGRLLKDGDFSLEVVLAEDGIPPEFRLYPHLKDEPMALDHVHVTMALHRTNGLPGGVIDMHRFAPEGDYLLSPTEVDEPHSYDVVVNASHAGQTYEWRYASPEGRVSIDADMAQAQGLHTAISSGGVITETLTLYGVIRPNAEQLRTVSARFPGLVRRVAVSLGDTVTAGQVLATVESNESLQLYSVTAPIAGTVTARNINPGEATGAAPLFEIADFSTVWAELSVFARDRKRLGDGRQVTVRAVGGEAEAQGEISYVSPQTTVQQALMARVVLANVDGQWTPGQFVDARVLLASTEVKQVVPLSALQTFRDWEVVFVAEGDTYQALPVQLGRRDTEQVEVLSGLAPGARIVVNNSYLVKADIEKSGVSHDH